MRSKISAILISAGIVAFLWVYSLVTAGREPIKVGVLHSLSGTMAISERPVADATLLAIEEINAQGGLLGRKIEPVIVDGASDAARFALEAERLITEEKVSVVFGCWTSASRKRVKHLFEKYDHLLFYPVQYEGLEQSPNIVYAGAAPNQQIIPAVKWAFDNLGKTFYLVGSDYVFPHAANEIIKLQLAALGGTVVGEEYLPLGANDVANVVSKIAAARPEVILNTVNGDANVAFFAGLSEAGMIPNRAAVLSFSIAENEVGWMDAPAMAGSYAAWNYFQSIQSAANRKFVESFKRKHGSDAVLHDPMESAYVAVHLWAQAVREAGTVEPDKVRRTVLEQSFNAPGGLVHVDAETQHLWKTVRIGKIGADGQFDIVWTSENPVRPVPYPLFRAKAEWEKFLAELQRKWGGDWADQKNGERRR